MGKWRIQAGRLGVWTCSAGLLKKGLNLQSSLRAWNGASNPLLRAERNLAWASTSAEHARFDILVVADKVGSAQNLLGVDGAGREPAVEVHEDVVYPMGCHS